MSQVLPSPGGGGLGAAGGESRAGGNGEKGKEGCGLIRCQWPSLWTTAFGLNQ